jgi:hypothetical protein
MWPTVDKVQHHRPYHLFFIPPNNVRGVVAEWLSAWLPHRRVSGSNLGEDWDLF